MAEGSDGGGEGASEWEASVPKIRYARPCIGGKLSLIDGNTWLPRAMVLGILRMITSVMDG